MTEMLHQGFNPDSGLFTYSASGDLYPSPGAPDAVEEWREMYSFLGRLLVCPFLLSALLRVHVADYLTGKESFRAGDGPSPAFSILHLPHSAQECQLWSVQLPRGRSEGPLTYHSPLVNDLATLDPVMYRNMMALKNYPGDVEEDLSLTFSVTDTTLGGDSIVNLVPNGQNKAVTNQNRMQYILLMARYRLNTQLQAQLQCFLHGLQQVIPQEWIEMFNEEELQQLISGLEGPLDLDDFRAHTVYSGGYDNDHPVIQTFWIVLESLSPQQQRKFLRFATSTERSPLLGFAFLEPKFAIQRGDDPSRLPSASTCFNLLKLPPYASFALMREKLVYAVESSSGFEMS